MTDSINVNAGCEQKALRNHRTKEKRKYGLQASRTEGLSSSFIVWQGTAASEEQRSRQGMNKHQVQYIWNVV